MITNTENVFVYKLEKAKYPQFPPFHPSQKYPEYQFKEISSEENLIYESFRNLLKLMGLDKKNWNTQEWNPFREIIQPGYKVLLKPNLVIDKFKHQNWITTHPSIIRSVIDYVIIALKGEGEIIIGDAPLQQCNFKSLVKRVGLEKIINYYNFKNVKVDLIDFRTEKMESDERRLYSLLTNSKRNVRVTKLSGDPNGYKIINLGNESNLQEISFNNGFKKFRVTNYDPSLMRKVHNLKCHKYLIPNSVLQANVVIHLPKIKSHRKAGITGCLKNNIGINGHKDWLPHHRKGSIKENGDEYLKPNILKRLSTALTELKDIALIRNPSLYKLSYYPFFILRLLLFFLSSRINKDKFFEGSWYGNDTIWRTIADLNQILLYADKIGNMKQKVQRKRLYFCDGIIGGENEGPIDPSPINMGIIIGGFDPLMVDLAIAELMNFDFKRIPQIKNIFNLKNRKISNHQPNDLKIFSNNTNWNEKKISEVLNSIKFNPSSGWKNYIEKKN